jgi:hypothetical protein
MEGDPCRSTITTRAAQSAGVALDVVDGIGGRAFLEPHANGSRSLPCLATIVHFATALDLARKLKPRSTWRSVVRSLRGTVAK